MNRPLLVIGFEPFEGTPTNPSAEVVGALAGEGLVTAVLPVSYARAPAILKDLLSRERYGAVLLLGVAANRNRFSLERVAINFQEPGRVDESGERPSGGELVRGGPAAYFSTLPLDGLLLRLVEKGLPAEISLSAGAFLCNAVFYHARHLLQAGTPCGFCHLPPTPGMVEGAQGIEIQRQIEAVRLLVEYLRSETVT
ncbi:MAG: hypothetical protein V2A76_02930 [Planctomycetota bacterium]